MLSKSKIQKIIECALETGGDFAEIFVEDKTTNNLNMVSGVLEKAISGRDYGIGIRILKDNFCIYAYTNDLSEQNLIKVAKMAAQGIIGQNKNIVLDLNKKAIENIHKTEIMPKEILKNEKIEWLKRAHEAAKGYDPVIQQTVINYIDSVQNVLIANSEGLIVEDIRPINRMSITAIATSGNLKETASITPGTLGGMEYMRNLDIESYARKAAKSAKVILNADFAPSGVLPVVIGNGFGGVLFHEACGHGLEATNVANNTSVFAGKIGQKVASDIVTAYDDGTIQNSIGSLNIDDEGMKTQKNLLIEDGILKGYLIDTVGSRKMRAKKTGSGRRASYKFNPTSRMNNTYIAAGKSKPEDIISNTEYGIYAKTLAGGSVNVATGEYNFAVNEGYLIKNGKIAGAIKGATLIGDGMDTLKKIDMVADDLKLEAGTCGSRSGLIPVTVGQPTLRVSGLTVGGRKE